MSVSVVYAGDSHCAALELLAFRYALQYQVDRIPVVRMGRSSQETLRSMQPLMRAHVTADIPENSRIVVRQPSDFAGRHLPTFSRWLGRPTETAVDYRVLRVQRASEHLPATMLVQRPLGQVSLSSNLHHHDMALVEVADNANYRIAVSSPAESVPLTLVAATLTYTASIADYPVPESTVIRSVAIDPGTLDLRITHSRNGPAQSRSSLPQDTLIPLRGSLGLHPQVRPNTRADIFEEFYELRSGGDDQSFLFHRRLRRLVGTLPRSAFWRGSELQLLNHTYFPDLGILVLWQEGTVHVLDLGSLERPIYVTSLNR